VLSDFNEVNAWLPVFLYCTWYPKIIPLGVSGDFHDRTTLVSVILTAINDLGAEGTKIK